MAVDIIQTNFMIKKLMLSLTYTLVLRKFQILDEEEDSAYVGV